MGRIALLAGIGILAYGHYTHSLDNILSLAAYSLIAFGAIFYFFTDLK